MFYNTKMGGVSIISKSVNKKGARLGVLLNYVFFHYFRLRAWDMRYQYFASATKIAPLLANSICRGWGRGPIYLWNQI